MFEGCWDILSLRVCKPPENPEEPPWGTWTPRGILKAARDVLWGTAESLATRIASGFRVFRVLLRIRV